MQNRHVMRPQIRLAYERALEQVDGDAAFAVRFERFFTELRAALEFGLRREHAGSRLTLLANFSARDAVVDGHALGPYGYGWLS